jgi:hypothetical protein
MDDVADVKAQRMLIRPGRHVGWWLEGRSTPGRRFMWTWWPTKGLAALAARVWAAIARRVGDRIVTIESGGDDPDR